MSSAPESNRRILVIDDNPDIHRDFRKVLAPSAPATGDLADAEAMLFGEPTIAAADAGFVLDSASQGEEGLGMVRAAVAAGRPYAVVFVDMRMPPGWDGMETISRLMPEDPRLQVVICTAFSDYSWQQIFQRTGRTDRLLIVKKPFDPVEVVQLAHALTAKWALARRLEGEFGRLESAVSERTRELSDTNRALMEAVAEQRIAAEQLRRSESRFRAVIDSAGSAIAIVDHRGIIWMWNPGAERLFGWSGIEALGRSITSILPGLTGDDLRRSLETLLGDAAGGSRPLELAAVARDGKRLMIELGIASWRNEEGEFYSCIMQDIGPRKQAESAIRNARDAAEASTRAKGDFLAVMSHELRTPMNGIIGMTDLLLETGLDGQQSEFAGTVRECASSLLRLIDEILDFSRIESGRLEVERIPFDVRGTAEGVVELLAAQAERKGIELALDVDVAVPAMVEGDPTRLRQVLTNLAGNAVKFTAVGHVTMRIACPDPVTGILRFTVEDTGIGIPAEAQASLFQPFTQADAGITRRYGGSGLGLAICQRLVGLMGGSMAFASTAERGSRFWFDIPLVPSLVAAGAARPLPPADLRVLYVDANANGRMAMQGLLNGWRMACDTAPGGERALELVAGAAAAGEPYAVAVVERMLGGEDGLALVGRLRAAGGPPVLVLALDAQPGLGAAARAAGAAGFLPRPVRRGHLYEAIVEVATGAPAMVTRHTLEDARRLARPRVLLVDGDPAHRRLVLRTLEREGCRVDTALPSPGLAAACASSGHVLVLLDLAAGEGGPAFIHALRSSPGPAGRIPVLVWGVAADAAGRDACVAAGADPLDGPPDAAVLGERLRQWLPDTDQREIAGPPADPASLPVAIDIGRLRRHAAGLPLAPVLDRLASALPAAGHAVILAVARDQPAEVQSSAGALRKLCEEAGALPLASLAETLERMGEAYDRVGAARVVGELHAAMRAAEAALRRLRLDEA